jgi:hypothetical protein
MLHSFRLSVCGAPVLALAQEVNNYIKWARSVDNTGQMGLISVPRGPLISHPLGIYTTQSSYI